MNVNIRSKCGNWLEKIYCEPSFTVDIFTVDIADQFFSKMQTKLERFFKYVKQSIIASNVDAVSAEIPSFFNSLDEIMEHCVRADWLKFLAVI